MKCQLCKKQRNSISGRGTLRITESERLGVFLRICKATSLLVAESMREPCMDMHDQEQRQRPGKKV